MVRRQALAVTQRPRRQGAPDARGLLDAVIAAAGFALKNERLSAELHARVSELGASRARILDAGDKERRRLERNLHDGAQQRLVALSMQLTLLKARIRDDPASAEELAAKANADLAESLEELRELARGIHPSALDHGLAVALESLAAQSVVSTRVTVELVDRLPEPIEVAAYRCGDDRGDLSSEQHAQREVYRCWEFG